MGGKRASKTEPEQFASYLVREHSKRGRRVREDSFFVSQVLAIL
jgi:hypothetical protein